MVEVGDGSFSRELCGGTHVRFTAEVGLFKVLTETSSAANVRRIEAVTGPAAVTLLRHHDQALGLAARELRATPEQVPELVAQLRARVRELERGGSRGPAADAVDIDQLAGEASEHDGATILATAVSAGDGKALLQILDRLKAKLGDAAIVLGAAGEGRVDLVVSVSPALVDRGLHAGEIVKAAAEGVGGGGGGRDTMARAGGRDPEKLPEAMRVAREKIESALSR
jgi:alanyl-tRNA synthetase